MGVLYGHSYRRALDDLSRLLLAIIDRTGFKLDRASSHYVKRVRKKRNYVSLTAIYSPEIDACFPATVTPDSISELTALREYLLGSIADAKIFWGLLGGKRFDSSDIITRLEALGIVPIIPTRMGMLKPKSDPCLRYSLICRSFIKHVVNVRNLIESAFASLKSFAQDFIRSVFWGG